MSGFDERRYQVFVSSTFTDLQLERQKVLQAVLEMKAFPSGMELFPSADDEQWAFIEKEIESSDYYVVIVAGKYGSVAADGLSFTEKEYDYAVRMRKPVMGFLVSDLGQLRGVQLEQDDASKEKLQRFRDKVKRGKLVKFFQNADELKSLVMQSLMHAFGMRPQVGWVRAGNARRLEDLEEITRLQKRVIELDEENRRLKSLSSDATAAFAQGDDVCSWRLHLKWLTPEGRLPDGKAKSPIPPPADLFEFRTTWNALFAACFEHSPRVAAYKAVTYVSRLLASAVRSAFPEGEPWLTLYEKRLANPSIRHEEVADIVKAIQRQFLGLGLMSVNVVQRPVQSDGPFDSAGREETYWELTEKGNLQYLALRGVRRPEVLSAPDTEPPA